MQKRIIDKVNSKLTFGKISDSIKDDKDISFSYKYLILEHKKFSITKKDYKYFLKLFTRLKDVSQYTQKRIIHDHSKTLRVHPINWKDTTEPKGFTHLNEQLKQIPPYQISISSNEHGRVHGFFVDHIFFIVWFDPDHNLYK